MITFFDILERIEEAESPVSVNSYSASSAYSGDDSSYGLELERLARRQINEYRKASGRCQKEIYRHSDMELTERNHSLVIELENNLDYDRHSAPVSERPAVFDIRPYSHVTLSA